MRRIWLVAWLVGAGGCNALLGIDDLSVAGSTDGGSTTDATDCVGMVAPTCFQVPATGEIALSGTIDTSTDPRCVAVMQANTIEMCALRAESFTTSGPVTVTGARPLMLVATAGIELSHDVQAASRRGGPLGPGASPLLCAQAPAGSDSSNDGGGGGAGGTLASKGGDGGDGGGGGGGNGADPADVAAILGVRGGCGGSNGGRGTNSAAGDVGGLGAGGGAIYLVAGTRIALTAKLDASGAPGIGGLRNRTGGGGGGAGGMIVLEAPVIVIEGPGAQLVANGGGGGEGATSGSMGTPGLNSPTWNVAGAGGDGLTGAGDGGAGSVANGDGRDGTDGSGGGTDGGGGGGGGGRGLIQVTVTPTGPSAGQISPGPTLVQP